MIGAIGRVGEYLRWAYELLISVYFALLLVSVNQMTAEYSWALRVRSLYVSHRYPHASIGIDDVAGVRLASFLLAWLVAIAVFFVLHLLTNFSFTRVVLRTATGVAAVVGLPLAHIHSGHPEMFFLKVELVISAACVILFAFRRWPVSTPLNIFLLLLHFGLWTAVIWDSFSFDLVLLWPAWDKYWYSWKQAHLAYALLGLCCSLVWGAYVKRSGVNEHPPSPLVAG